MQSSQTVRQAYGEAPGGRESTCGKRVRRHIVGPGHDLSGVPAFWNIW
jgi:hypothetical protein